MGSGTFYSDVAGDDGYWTPSGSFVSTNTYVVIGNNGENRRSFFRFNSVSIEKDKEITAAQVAFYCSSREPGTVDTKIYVVDQDNPSAPADTAEADAMPLSSSYVGWTVSTSDNTYIYTPDISSILTEHFARAGWVPGNSLIIVVESTSSTDSFARSMVLSREYNEGYYKPSISITESSGLNISLTLPSFTAWGGAGNAADITLSSISMDAFPLGVTGAVADMSLPAMQTLQFGGEVLLPLMEVSGTASMAVVGDGAVGSMEIRIDNDGLGGLSCFAVAAPIGAMALPAATADGIAKRGTDGLLTLPVVTMVAQSGCGGDVSVPAFEVSAWTTNPGRSDLVMTQMGMSAFVYHAGSLAHGAVRLPKPKVSASGMVGRIGRAAVGLRLVVAAHGVSGQLASASSRMVPLQASGTAHVVSRASGTVSIHPVAIDALATADSSEFIEPVAYSREAIR